MIIITILLVGLAGLAVGVLSALFGVGGGILMVPLMVIALGTSQHVAEGTSLLVIVPTAIAGVLVHRRRGYVSFRHAMLLAVGGLGGAYVGALLALNLPEAVLQRVFGILVAVTGLRFAARGVRALRMEHAHRDTDARGG